MLPWLQKNLNRKQQLILKIVVVVIILHLLLLVAFFFLGNSTTLKRSITLTAIPNSDMKVVFLPMYKSIKNQPATTCSDAKIVQSKVSQPVGAKAVPQKKITPKPATTQVRQASQPAKATPKPGPKPLAKPVVKKPAPAKQAPKPAPAKQAPKPAPAKQPQVKNDIEKQEKTKSAQQTQKDNSDTVAQLPTHLALGDKNVIYVGQEEHALMRVQEHLQHELARCWKAPTTITDNLACDLLVKVDEVGHAGRVIIAKSSGAKLYDMLAQKAFRAIDYPKELWGQEITFTFKGQ